ncbi:MAG TPA: cysteine desulfurase family protein [Xanthobacteraceae bacterium]|nr:cysteine desulfurase family protein [Xanthobacteraceae bacterium]
MQVYLDHNATSPLRPKAREAVLAALPAGNASSVHGVGRAARARVETAREQVSALVGADPRAVTFTSGATESIALALSPAMEIDGRPVAFDVLLVSGVEHPAVRAGGRFAADRVEIVPVDADGVVDLVALAARMTGRRALVSVMAANNETGAIEPVRAVADLVHGTGGVFHCDAVQIVGRVPFDLENSGADLISISSHKFGGPQGAGALIARNDDIRIPPLLRGGGQERGHRAGTENVAAVAGFGTAADEARRNGATESARVAALRDRLEAGIRATAPDVTILSGGAARLPNTTCFAAPGIAAETAVIAFDLEGVAVSAGSACSSGKVGPSQALAAMQVPPEVARGAVRASLGWNSTEADVDRFLEVWARVHAALTERRATKAA